MMIYASVQTLGLEIFVAIAPQYHHKVVSSPLHYNQVPLH
jgi:hypothetical protein